MKKSEAINILGGNISAAAKAIGVSYQAVAKWPDPLSPRIVDRVIAAQARMMRSSRRKPTLKEPTHA
ncbi:hypothetical protein PT7_P077 (plasmid) [Pusillimonas sp. T7-7]|uniref:hypothetical protein n=1 Tax=Pusillimonas sp. (strain T7-7) TaxID=1007105 RepID=UPI0002084BDA|nr:hypothetical protein [Pusillimonas sp. T7-7]AEC22313.1 hypothetical protein PT7_P077 [Pusillimonas sp. T7-7]